MRTIQQTQRLLLCRMAVQVGVPVLLAALFETDLLPVGMMAGTRHGTEFVAAIVMELLTIVAIPLALKLFKLRFVAKRLTSPDALMKFGSLRLDMLTLPLLANTLLYYMYMNVAFGYLAIILLLCLFFVYPSMDRCRAEAGGADGTDEDKDEE